MQKQSKSGVTVAYAKGKWAIMFPDSRSGDVDQWLPESQVLMTELRNHIAESMGYKIIKPAPKPTKPKKAKK